MSINQDIDHGLIEGFDLHVHSIMDALGTHDSRNYSKTFLFTFLLNEPANSVAKKSVLASAVNACYKCDIYLNRFV